MIDVKQLKMVLAENVAKEVHLVLPGGEDVPQHFHVTEIGGVRKDFIDCGGTQRVSSTALIQCWVATDVEHRIGAEKFLKILEMGAKVLAGDFLPVEIEYEAGVISQYPLEAVEVTGDAVVLRLTAKHTDCLAKEKCGVPTTDEAEEDC
ncbi:DUF6428 family protein [Akkermansiaceae bacterium]|nr:DUF6428 family protein [Akkermansiaceae bacterium]